VSRRILAAFDFDGTLTRRDTLLPFLTNVAGRLAVLRALAAESAGLALAAVGRGDRDAVKERLLTRVLAGQPIEEVDAAGQAFGAELARSAITVDARERIAWHRSEGHELVIVSASLDVYLGETARVLGIDQVLCTGLVADERGRVTGQLRGANCRGPEKANRLRALFGDDDVELWAYGNSSGDDEMLDLAHHPVRFRRGRVHPGGRS
jgi:HAD superfamily hydrolase (TIGR01490 family)